MRDQKCAQVGAIGVVEVKPAFNVADPLVLLRSHGGVPLGEVRHGSDPERPVRIELTGDEDRSCLLEQPSISLHPNGPEGINNKPEVLRRRVLPPAQQAFHLQVGVEVAHHQDVPKPEWEVKIAPAVALVVHVQGQLIDDPSAGPFVGALNDSVDEAHDPIVHADRRRTNVRNSPRGGRTFVDCPTMAIDTEGQWWVGDSSDDLAAYLVAMSRDGAPITHFARMECPSCGSGWFRVRHDDVEGCAETTCLECDRRDFELGSEDVAEAADLQPTRCPCGGDRFDVAAGLAVRDTGEIRWIYLGVRCVRCGVLGCPVDWDPGTLTTADLVGQEGSTSDSE